MGYEVAGGLGVKLADPDREVFVMVGDGSWLMMSSEIATSIQEGARLTVVLVDNRGFGSIGGLSRSLGSEGFGTAYRRRGSDGQLSGAPLELDLAANARSLGAHGVRAGSIAELRAALARGARAPTAPPSSWSSATRAAAWAPTSRGGTCRWPRSRRCRPWRRRGPTYERERARERPFPGGARG